MYRTLLDFVGWSLVHNRWSSPFLPSHTVLTYPCCAPASYGITRSGTGVRLSSVRVLLLHMYRALLQCCRCAQWYVLVALRCSFDCHKRHSPFLRATRAFRRSSAQVWKHASSHCQCCLLVFSWYVCTDVTTVEYDTLCSGIESGSCSAPESGCHGQRGMSGRE
jgi:hypothetical protein